MDWDQRSAVKMYRYNVGESKTCIHLVGKSNKYAFRREQGEVVHTYNPSTLEGETGGLPQI